MGLKTEIYSGRTIWHGIKISRHFNEGGSVIVGVERMSVTEQITNLHESQTHSKLLNMGFTSVYQLGRAGRGNGGRGNL